MAMRRGMAGVLLVCVLVAALVLTKHANPDDGVRETASIAFGDRRQQTPSLLGTFPPTEVVDPGDWSKLGIRVPGYVPAHLEGAPVEVRTSLRGAYLVTIGHELFLTHRPVGEHLDWTLQVPNGYSGALRVAAASVDAQIGLGIESPGDFSRLSWSDGRWSYVLFSPAALALEELVRIASSMR